ncbi:MAG: ribonuclease HII [Anaerolineae bacterium]
MSFRSNPAYADRRPTLAYERKLWSEGYRVVVGIDEAGRGAWAGPVVAAAVVFEPAISSEPTPLAPIRDSKLLSPRQRDRCYDLVLDTAAFWGVGSVASQEIDRIGILNATRIAMALAVTALSHPGDYLLIDAVRLPALDIPQLPIIKGDLLSFSIAAASILAKVTRDRAMRELDRSLPGYGLARHKGYGTAFHQAALADLGPSVIHRHSYAPIAALDGPACNE